MDPDEVVLLERALAGFKAELHCLFEPFVELRQRTSLSVTASERRNGPDEQAVFVALDHDGKAVFPHADSIAGVIGRRNAWFHDRTSSYVYEEAPEKVPMGFRYNREI
jgi:hypothetical protein